MDDAEQKIHDDVTGHGWHVINVLGEGAFPPFSYTIGLFKTFHHPEILVYGLASTVAHPLINDIGEQVRQGKSFLPGHTYRDLLEGYDGTFRLIPKSQYPQHMGFATWYYGGSEYTALQFIYPDRQGRWPWDSEVAPQFKAEQRVLADAPALETEL